MATIGEDFRSWLQADTDIVEAVGDRIHQTHPPQTHRGDFIWFARATTEHERTIDQTTGTAPFRELWDLEAVGERIDSVDDLIDLVRLRDSYRGSFGDGSIQAVFIADQADDYLPRSIDADSGLYVAAVSVELVGYSSS